MSRRAVSEVLGRMAFAAEMLDDPRARAYGAAAWSIRQVRGDLAEMLASGELGKVRGVGASTVDVVRQVLAGGVPEQLEAMEAQLPAGLMQIRRISGLGPKKVKVLWKTLGIESLGELEYACLENRLIELEGFGTKTQDKALAGIASLREHMGRCRLDQADRVAAAVQRDLAAAATELRVAVVGSLRRRTETVDGVDLLVVGTLPPDVATEEQRDGVLVRLHVRDPDERRYGVHLALLTGSDGHLRALQDRATDAGLHLGPLGLYRDDELIDCSTEEALYDALGVHAPAPERREDDVPLTLKGEAPPRLVRRSDLLGALHNHTVASDGSDTLAQLRHAAGERGLTYLGVSEHSVSAAYARGLDIARLVAQVAEIAAMNAEGHSVRLISGIESDILGDGALDYEGEVLASLEVVVASVHQRHGQGPEAMTTRMVAAARNPWTTIVGHPTGRLLLARPPSDYDVEAFLDACAESGCAVELNANPHRLDLNEHHLAMARGRGVPISIAADAHASRELDNLDYGIAIARRAGLRPEDVLNCRPANEVLTWAAQVRSQRKV